MDPSNVSYAVISFNICSVSLIIYTSNLDIVYILFFSIFLEYSSLISLFSNASLQINYLTSGISILFCIKSNISLFPLFLFIINWSRFRLRFLLESLYSLICVKYSVPPHVLQLVCDYLPNLILQSYSLLLLIKYSRYLY